MHRSRPTCRFDTGCQSPVIFHELFPSPIRLADWICPLLTPEERDHPRATLDGSKLRSTLAITKGRCSPAFPDNVYDRSNPLGPRIFISQPSFSREPTIDTRQSPGLSLKACSTSARTSAPVPGSPVLCSSSKTAISNHFTVDEPSGSDRHRWVRHALCVCLLIARVLVEKPQRRTWSGFGVKIRK
jgi:hypothetical protein